MSDTDTLVRISRLYYELGETQERIAELVGLTRPQVSRLLKRARERGIVDIRVHDETGTPPAVGILQERFGLREVHLAPSVSGPEDVLRRSVGRVAARVLRTHVHDGSVLGLSDGAHMAALADALPESPQPIACVVVPLGGGWWFGGGRAEPYRRVAQALGATAISLYAPAVLPDPSVRVALEAHPTIGNVRALWARLDIAVFGVGHRAWTAETFGEAALAELDASAAVGEIVVLPFDREGRFVGQSIRERIIAVEPEALARVPVTIAVAAGSSKVVPLLGALRTGCIRILVTDVATAEAVIAEADRDLESGSAAGPEQAARPA
ncbi:MAG: sugar-binding domain-containing protein [Chloroflexota bacterium]